MSAAVAHNWKPIAAAIVAAVCVASLGALVTELGPWYYSLRLPAWKPPDALFGPAWTLIFACAAAAGVKGWRALTDRGSRIVMCGFFSINALLNLLWSLLFFRLHRPDWALLEVVLLWLSILILMVMLQHRSRPAAWLLLPYLAWVSFAAMLNLAIVRLNASFA
jgi:tryptophan-rich sensory protein